MNVGNVEDHDIWRRNSCDLVGTAESLAAAALMSLPDMTPSLASALFCLIPKPVELWSALVQRSSIGTGSIRGDREEPTASDPGGDRVRDAASDLRYERDRVSLGDCGESIDSRSRASIARRWRGWHRAANDLDVEHFAARLHEMQCWVVSKSEFGYPSRLINDERAPSVLFGRGDPSYLEGSAVAIVGTRRSTRYGRRVAFELANFLSSSGVTVVSGLARGIDGMAHRGALDGEVGGTAAVIGCGIDVCYPSEHRQLQADIERSGVVISEAPLGSPPIAWRFPARNRIIAGLVDAVVVVESGPSGGSMHTVNEAASRGVTVVAVPGPLGSFSSEGTNRLIRDGCEPMLSYEDVLRHVADLRDSRAETTDNRHKFAGECTCWRARGQSALAHRRDTSANGVAGVSQRHIDEVNAASRAHGPTISSDSARVLGALDERPCALDELAVETLIPVTQLIGVLQQLEADGLVQEERGWWIAGPTTCA